MTADAAVTALLSVGTMIILARLVGPREFGLAALVVGTILMINLFVEGLLHDALIQNPDVDDTVFNEGLSLVVVIASIAIAVSFGSAFALENTSYGSFAWLFAIASVSLAFSGPLGVANARLRRSLQYAEVARASIFGKFVACAAGIAIAWSGYGAWAMIAQYALGIIVQTIILYGTAGWSPRVRLSFRSLYPLLRFALPYASMHSVVAARIQGFALLVVALMGLESAGFINVAFRITTTPLIALTTTLANYYFPLLSSKQKSRHDLLECFRSCTKVVSVVAAALFVGLALVADDFVSVLLGPTWSESADLVRLVAISASLSLARVSSSLLLRALGHVRYSLMNALFQLAFTLGGLVVLRPSRPLFAVELWLLPVILQYPLTWIVLQRKIGIGLWQQVAPYRTAIVGAAAMAVAVLTFQHFSADVVAPVRLAGSVTSGGVAFIIAIYLADREVRSAFSKLRR